MSGLSGACRAALAGAIAWTALLGVSAPGGAQEPTPAPGPEVEPPPEQAAGELSVRLEGAEGYVGRDAALSLRFSRPLAADERVVVFIGPTDMTDLFRAVPGGLDYLPQIVSLPSGESEVTAYLVTEDGEWREAGRFPLQVRGALGIERARASPGLDLGLEGQLAEGHEPDGFGPERSTYQDLTGQLSLETEAVRGPVRASWRSSVIGVSNGDRALRAGELAGEAPKVDLSDYVLQLDLGPSTVSLGHVAMGRQRHLISGFGSRGAAFSVRPGSRLDFSLGAANGSSVVGWGNFLGLADSDHRIVSGTLGLEVLRRPGLLRLELSGMDGSVLPFAGYNQGIVNDAEESRGVGFGLRGSDPTGRLRLEGGFARSTFTNPEDPSLSLGAELVPVAEVTRNARYLEASLDVLRGLRLGGSRTAELGLSFGHERVDPLYRSLAAYAGSDQLSNRWSAQASVAGVAIQASHARSEDNLDEIPSILKTLTRRSGVSVSVPLQNVTGAYSPWVPSIAWGLDRTHQFGDDLPPNSGFSPSHVPDQVSRSHSLSADWRHERLSFSYRLSRSEQDNRQEGRENADFAATTHGLAADVRPLASLSLGLTLDLERAENQEVAQIDRTRRVGARGSWNPYGGGTLALSLSRTVSEDEAETRERTNTVFDAQWSSGLPGFRAFGVQYYLRFGRTIGDAVDRVFGLDSRTVNWSVDSGLNLRFF